MVTSIRFIAASQPRDMAGSNQEVTNADGKHDMRDKHFRLARRDAIRLPSTRLQW
jgi:hypothetical protein